MKLGMVPHEKCQSSPVCTTPSQFLFVLECLSDKLVLFAKTVHSPFPDSVGQVVSRLAVEGVVVLVATDSV